MGVTDHPTTATGAVHARLAHERGRAATAMGRASTAAHHMQALHWGIENDRRRRAEVVQSAHRTIAESRRIRAQARDLRAMTGRASLIASAQYHRLACHRSGGSPDR